MNGTTRVEIAALVDAIYLGSRTCFATLSELRVKVGSDRQVNPSGTVRLEVKCIPIAKAVRMPRKVLVQLYFPCKAPSSQHQGRHCSSRMKCMVLARIILGNAREAQRTVSLSRD